MQFDSAFLSMYPLDFYREEDFAYFRAQTLFKASYCIPDYSTMKAYLQRIAKSGNTITTIYLGIRPDQISPAQLQALTEPYPFVTFEVIFAYPSAEYWQGLSSEDYENVITSYCNFLNAAPDIAGVDFFFFGSSEWLLANPSNYQDLWQVTESLSRMIMLNSYFGEKELPYLITADNAAQAASDLENLTRKLRNQTVVWPDLSDHCIVFFGDSVIGNYTNTASIPGVVAGLTGATVYNCGYGGNSAALGIYATISLPGIIDAFFRADLSVIPQDFQIYKGMSAYLENPPAEDQPLCIVINYGLNDYFSGYPITSDDPYDVSTYCGAIRTAVKSIRANAPQAQIILCAPTFSAAFQYGTQLMSENGSTLQVYADAVLALAEELDTDVLDNYYGLGINYDTWQTYLEGDVHPNEYCRYLIGCRIIDLIR